jgi:hypothetical protein
MSDTLPAIVSGGELSVDEVQAQVKKVQALMNSIMRKGEHYGTVPGTSSKMTLFKAGAEKLGFTFRLAPEFEVTEKDLKDGHKEFKVICTVTHMGTGSFVAQGVGYASTMEKKYRYRKQQENPDIADTYNTVLKMAKKRAHVDAMITATAASDIFTQDVEDIVSLSGLPAAEVRKLVMAIGDAQDFLEGLNGNVTEEQKKYICELPLKAVDIWEETEESPADYIHRVLKAAKEKMEEKEESKAEEPQTEEPKEAGPLMSEFNGKIGKTEQEGVL